MLKILGMAAVLVKSSASFEIDCFMDTSHPMERLMSINCYQNELYQNPDEETLQQQLSTMLAGESSWHLDTAFGAGPLGGKYYFVRGQQVASYKLHAGGIQEQIGSLSDWGLEWTKIDAAFASVKWGKKVYFFKGDQYTAYNLAEGRREGVGALSAWKLPWSSIDAAFRMNKWGNAIYFFKGKQFVRFDEDKGTVSKPRSIREWKVFWKGIDAAVPSLSKWGEGVFFFKGKQYMRYNVDRTVNRPDPGQENIQGWVPSEFLKESAEGSTSNVVTSIRGAWACKYSGNHGITASLTKGVTNAKGVSTGKEATAEVSVSASAEVTAGGDAYGGSVTAGIETSVGVSASISQEVSQQIEHSTETTCEASCDADPERRRTRLCQWVNNQYDANNNFMFALQTCHYWCYVPKSGEELPKTPFD